MVLLGSSLSFSIFDILIIITTFAINGCGSNNIGHGIGALVLLCPSTFQMLPTYLIKGLRMIIVYVVTNESIFVAFQSLTWEIWLIKITRYILATLTVF